MNQFIIAKSRGYGTCCVFTMLHASLCKGAGPVRLALSPSYCLTRFLSIGPLEHRQNDETVVNRVRDEESSREID